MKRFAIAIFLSTILHIIFFSIMLGLEESGITSEETSFAIATPLRLPVVIYEDVLNLEYPPFDDEDEITQKEAFVLLYLILFNIILYGIIIYFIMTLILKIRGKPKETKHAEPPEPPVFE